MEINLKLLNNDAEIVQSYLPNLNIAIQINKLSYFYGKRALCHWHEDIELVKIISGEMNYYVNGENINLKAGEGIIINSKAMHYGYSKDNKDCDFICVLISPNIFSNNQLLTEKYITPITNKSKLSYLKLSNNNEKHIHLIDDINIFGELYKHAKVTDSNIEFQCFSVACLFWDKWFKLIKDQLNLNEINNEKDILIQKKMVNFIYQNYMNKISIEDIAQSANICRSRCCKYFKKYTQQTPMEFVINYRIKIAKKLISQKELKITEVALSCGFNNFSYFSKQFLKLTGLTPKKYQKLKSRMYEKLAS